MSLPPAPTDVFRNRLPIRSRAIAGFLLASTALSLTGCQTALMDPAGPIGAAEKTILIDSVAIMLVIVVPTIVAILGFAWWFRAANTRARRLPDWSFSGQIELVVWAVPVMVIILLGSVSWIGAHALDPAKPLAGNAPALEIQVVSLDWKWLFIYPDQQVAAVNELVVPAGVPLHFSLTSASVMNTFFIPRLGSMIYTMNGMVNQLNLQADRPGTYRGLSGHYSGDGFADMHFEVRAVSKEDFATWAAGIRGTGQSLDDTRYRTLAQQSLGLRPFVFGSVQAGLFDRVVAQTLAPGPGPGASSVNAPQAPR
jgi:cytochrome o ubiquinol oxidase subunit 2